MDSLKAALDIHATSLIELDIEVDVDVENGEPFGELGSFAHYTVLEHQRIWLNPFKFRLHHN
jgi:hypothetical protein